jgi:hypothetical protein
VRRTEGLYDYELSADFLLERLATLDLTGCTVDEYYDLDLVRGRASNGSMNDDLDPDSRLAWADVALRCIDLILKTMPIDDPDFPVFLPRFRDPRSYWTRHHERDEMRVRANMIGAFGPIDVRGDCRDPEAVADWFLSTVQGESPNSVLPELAMPLIDLGIDRIRDLRTIKNNLDVVVLMLGHGLLPVAPPRDVVLLQWIALRDQLP